MRHVFCANPPIHYLGECMESLHTMFCNSHEVTCTAQTSILCTSQRHANAAALVLRGSQAIAHMQVQESVNRFRQGDHRACKAGGEVGGRVWGGYRCLRHDMPGGKRGAKVRDPTLKASLLSTESTRRKNGIGIGTRGGLLI